MENNTPQTSNNKLIYIISAIASIVIIILLSLYFNNRNEYQQVVEGLNQEKTLLTEEFKTLAVDYDSLSSNNDTLNLMLDQEEKKSPT